MASATEIDTGELRFENAELSTVCGLPQVFFLISIPNIERNQCPAKIDTGIFSCYVGDS